MAVFPDRIVLKNSTDDEATIVAAIEVGGADAITQGEIVLGLSDGAAALFTKDALGAIVAISGSGGLTGIDDLTDVDTTTSAPTDGQVLVWSTADSEWVPGDVEATPPSLEDLSDVSPDTPELGSYTTKGAINTVPATGEWSISASASVVFFPDIAANGYDIAALFAYRSPGIIGISTDNVKFTYYTVATWQNYGSYYSVDFGVDNQELYDNNTALYINFGPKLDLVDGVLAVYDAATQTYKIKKNRIADQSDFDYKREDAAYEYIFSTTDTPSPATGDAQRWTGYGDDSLFFSTTDKDGLDAEADLYSLVVGDDVAIFINGVEAYDGPLEVVANNNNSRISLTFSGGDQNWITNLTAGDIVGIRSPIFSRKPPALAIEDGQVLTWVDANSQWEPASYISKATLQAEVAASTDFANFQSRIAAL